MARANTSVLERAGGGGGDGELLLKLGVDVAQSTVANTWCGVARHRARTGRPCSATGIAAMDLLVLPTIGFRPLYGFVPGPGSPAYPLMAVTSHPTAQWVVRQIAEAFPWQETPQYLRRDRNAVYGHVVRQRLAAMGVHDRPITAGSPWQNGYIERPVGSISPRMHQSCHRARRRPSAQKSQALRDYDNRMRVLAPPSRPREDLLPRRGTLGKNRFRR
jgi:hypothetical protein